MGFLVFCFLGPQETGSCLEGYSQNRSGARLNSGPACQLRIVFQASDHMPHAVTLEDMVLDQGLGVTEKLLRLAIGAEYGLSKSLLVSTTEV